MAKKAIYLEERERDLARRVFDVAIYDLSAAAALGKFGSMACSWTRDEIIALKTKFQETPHEG